ncbi:MAG: glycosyltransferase family 4 protein, partial [Chloroflexi bacterium]|nr:glycosyltransferase family 4 protein [Chloroflexota bacterium]
GERIDAFEERRTYLAGILEQVDVALSPSHFLMEKIGEYGPLPRKMVYLPFGIRMTSAPKSQGAGGGEKIRIGYLGQMVPHKGVHLLLQAFHALSRDYAGCELNLYGRLDGRNSYEKKLLRMASGNPAIHFRGAIPNEQVGQVLSELDMIVVPSIWYENRPTVIVEAQMTGTPVIAARLGGMAELVEHGVNGLLFKPGNAEDLEEQLRYVCDHPEHLAGLSQGIRPVPTLEDEVAQLIKIYEGLLLPQPAA